LPIRTAILLIVLLIATLYATGRDPAFIAGFIAVNLLAFAVFGLSAYGIRQLAKRWRMRAPTLRLAMGNLSRPGSPTGTFILACGMSLMVLTASLLAEFNFQHRLDTVANTEAPSLFMIDVQPYQERGFIERITPLLGGNGYLRMHPYLQGRITKINGIPAKDVAVSEGLRRMLRGELGFSFSSTLPDGARFTAGKWWNADYHGPLLASVDDRFLPGMGLSIGDTITLDISGQEVEATIASARDIDYSTFHVNFTIVLSPGIISQFPRTAIAAVYLAPPYTAKPQVIETVKAHFPNVTLIQIDEAIRRTKEVFASIIRALRFTVLASLIAGALALVGALHTTLGHRHHETGVLKVLGVRKSAILKTYMAEWVIALLFTAPIAILIGVLGGWLIMQRIHHAFFYLRPDWLAMVAIGTCVFVGIISYLGNRKVVGTPLSTLLKPF
ncbi:MAG: ABC transporter permease, partial [Rickettsiales bacterium]